MVDRDVISTRTARIHLRDDGIILVEILGNVSQVMSDAKENLSGAIAAGHKKRRPVLLDLSRSEPLEAEVRHCYTGRILVDSFTALGIVVDGTPFGRMMGNIYMRVAKPGIPTQLFASADQATSWLIGHLK